jgi:hypothetical protein
MQPATKAINSDTINNRNIVLLLIEMTGELYRPVAAMPCQLWDTFCHMRASMTPAPFRELHVSAN